MEIAGVTLGAIPLILVALEKYATVARILKDYADYEATLSRLQITLWIQEEQYDDTMESIGLNDVSLDDVETHLRQRHPHKCDKFMSIIRRINATAERIAGMLEVGTPTKPKWRQESEKRFKAEMQRILLSLDLEDGELRQLFNELSALNKALKNCFGKMEVPSAETADNRVVKRLHACFDADQCVTANQNARLLHGAFQAGWGCTCSVAHKGCLRLTWHAEKWLSPAKFEMALSYASTPSGAAHELWRQFKVNVEDVRLPVSMPPATAPKQVAPAKSGLLEGVSKTLKRVRIQEHPAPVKGHSAVNTPVSIPAASLARTPSQITNLCSDIRHCADTAIELGYLVHPDPAFTQQVRLHSTLAKPSAIVGSHALIGQAKKARLGRKRRFEVAASVCWGVLLLADTDWLSEDLTKDEVQLMTSTCKTHVRDGLEDTYVSCTFEGSASNMNQPPPTTSPPRSFIRNRTLFALGVLLMELCLNRAFPALRNELQGNTAPINPGSTTVEDIDECLEEVYDEAGDEYGYAVQRCLRCEFPGPDRQKTFQHPPFRTHFFRGVVAPVQATYEMISNPTVMVV
ncbi:hypothetical protein C7974DRAFT_111674 [Boeremia exigua]|uniref:uncharacterized protein n=1 Tax=Boeremia exigua TaxID=749465 RepID=UPI001E8E9FE2|nr:uncharacterized protein C7974DRAFT_111674 [Boeremia exigua]KAH6642844.1 hypothetical protein C7974DRAFT_111674 [Boeremia exigua]